MVTHAHIVLIKFIKSAVNKTTLNCIKLYINFIRFSIIQHMYEICNAANYVTIYESSHDFVNTMYIIYKIK